MSYPDPAGKAEPAPWSRFRRFLRVAAAAGALFALAALLYLRWAGTAMPWPARLAVALGVFLSTLLAGGLMGLVFVSARGGYDADAADQD